MTDVTIAYRPNAGWVLTATNAANGEREHYGTFPTRSAAVAVALDIR